MASWSRDAMVPLVEEVNGYDVYIRLHSRSLTASRFFWRKPALGLFLLLLGR
jgi:hypothetical protein